MMKVLVLAFLTVGAMARTFSDDSYMHPSYKQTAYRTYAVGDKPEDSAHWRASAQAALKDKLQENRVVGKAKNVIMFLGDGWGVTTMTAARILKGQKVQNMTFGEEGSLHVDSFPHSGMSKTFCSNAQTADSACSATAYLCGVKTNTGTIGVTADVTRNECAHQLNTNNHVSSILAWAQAAGKSTGIVTTTRITHASPSGTYAHIANRDWECDQDIIENNADPKCNDIASQLILSEPGKNIDVIMGGGRRKFLPNNVTDEESQEKGERLDGKNLIEEWKRANAGLNATYVDNVDDLLLVNTTTTEKLLGLFAYDHLEYFHEQKDNRDPSLTDMATVAIEILSKNPNGYFLFVEGGRIDHAHHDNFALRSLWEAVEFDRAIEKGDEMTDDKDTLIVVTADHSHAFNIAGYAPRGSLVTAMGGTGDDDLPYSTLNYANGPGYKGYAGEKRHNLSEDGDRIHELTYRQTPLVDLDSETHGGEDVMIFSKGPFAHLLTGVQQQSYIPHVMAYASCVGNGLKYCDQLEATTTDPSSTTTPQSTTSSSSIHFVSLSLLVSLMFGLKMLVQF